MDVIKAGRTILLRPRDNKFPHKPHLWLVLTDPPSPNGIVVAVMVCTQTKFSDSTVILKVGDHPFIRHDSSVQFSSARYLQIPFILKEMEGGRCHLRKDMSRDLLKRVQEGLLISPRTVIAFREYCKKCFETS